MEKMVVTTAFVLLSLCPLVFVGAVTCATFKLCSPDSYFLYVILPWAGISVGLSSILYIYTMIKLIKAA